jgi:Fe-S cluster assembly protein SufD
VSVPAAGAATVSEGAASAAAWRRRVEEISAGEPGWLRTMREDALARFDEVGFPTTRDEEWRFTSVTPVTRLPYRAPSRGSVDEAQIRPHLLGTGCCARLVFVDGRHVPALSSSEPLPPGVRVVSLASLLRSEPDLLREHLGRLADLRHVGAFPALATALFEDGAAIVLPPRTCLPEPIDLVFVRTGAREAETVATRVLLLAGEGTRATLLERHVSASGGPAFTNLVLEADLGHGAHVEHVAMQDLSEDALHVSYARVVAGPDAVFSSHAVTLGGAFHRSDLDVLLGGEGAECHLQGLYLVDGDRLVDHHTRVDHVLPRGTSRELFKGIVTDRAHAVFDGKVVVHPDAQKTDARQANHNLLLSDDARVDTKPNLRIFADDVKCAHGTTVGQLDPDSLFYLRSRGIGAEEAGALLLRAFARDVVDRIEVPALRPLLDARIDARLERLGAGK